MSYYCPSHHVTSPMDACPFCAEENRCTCPTTKFFGVATPIGSFEGCPVHHRFSASAVEEEIAEQARRQRVVDLAEKLWTRNQYISINDSIRLSVKFDTAAQAYLKGGRIL